MFCSKCGKEINDDAVICVHCGCSTGKGNPIGSNDGKSWIVTLLLCLFTGGLGIHRFYTGYVGLGILQLLTLGGCGIWTLIDLICIIVGAYKTASGEDLVK